MTSDWLLLILPGLVWGASFLFIDEGLRSIGPNGVAFVRIAFGFATMACFPSARRHTERADWGSFAWLALFWFAFPLTMFPFAEQRVSSAMTGMLNGANPLFAALVASYISRQWPSRGVAAGLAVGLAGAVLIALPAVRDGRSSIAGILMILSALTSYGVALNLTQALQKKYGPAAVVWHAQGAALIMTAPFGLPDLFAAKWSVVPLVSLLLLGVFGTGIAYQLIALSTARFGAARASGTTFLIPVVALALGVAVRHEQVAAVSIAGCFVCLAGAWLMKRAR